MTYSLLCRNSVTGIFYDITELVGSVTYTTDLSGQPGKLTFTMQRDPAMKFQVAVGSLIHFNVNEKGLFLGYVFTMTVDEGEIYKITAYDQMRYLKNEETMLTENMTASQIFSKICDDTKLTYKVVTPTTFIVPEYLHQKQSLYSIMEYALMRTNIAEIKQYFIRDEFGYLTFTNTDKNLTNLILGDASLVTSYTYEISIDKESYNTVKIIRDNETTGKRDAWIVFDSNHQAQWGKLQYLIEAEKEQNEAQIVQLANNVLKLRNDETRTMKLNIVGTEEVGNVMDNTSKVNVTQLLAGHGFKLSLEKLGILQNMWITSITHNYYKDFHTASLEVFI